MIVFGILLGVGSWLWQHHDATSMATSTSTTVGAGFNPDASSATFTFDDGSKVTLSKGKGQSNDQGDNVQTTLLTVKGYGDLNGDGKNDAVLFLSQDGGGSGLFIYAAAFVSGPVGYKGTNAVFLGDRISPQSVSISHSVATVNYLDRKPDEPFSADPTVPTSKQFSYQNGQFVEK